MFQGLTLPQEVHYLVYYPLQVGRVGARMVWNSGTAKITAIYRRYGFRYIEPRVKIVLQRDAMTVC
jgi:hypothetical protein